MTETDARRSAASMDLVATSPVPVTRKERDIPTYRELAQLSNGRLSLTTVWRRVNKGRPKTLTRTRRELRVALVVGGLTQGHSIRRIASDLGISRSAVERDCRRVRQVITEHMRQGDSQETALAAVIAQARQTLVEKVQREAAQHANAKKP